jgi:bacterioferritin-associated ferredoxin
MSGPLKMTSFKDYLQGMFLGTLDFPSIKVSSQLSGHEFHLKFDSKDVLLDITYQGRVDAWIGALCALSMGKTLSQLEEISWKHWDEFFKNDQTYWDLKAEKSEDVFFAPWELLKAGLDLYRGREYVYRTSDSLICRCFGVRENDVLVYIQKTDDPTPEGLATETKAGMGCRSCVPQIKKWLSIHQPKATQHYYKEKTRANWLLEIDYMLSCFPHSQDWKMEVESFQAEQVIIAFDKEVTQMELENVSLELQDFLAAGLDSDLSFFLRRSRQRANA